MNDIKAMKKAILDEKAARGLECKEELDVLLEEYNCTLAAVPECVEIAPNTFGLTYSWKIIALDE